MKRCLFFLLYIGYLLPLSAQYSVTGGEGTPLLAEDNTSNRLKIYLFYGMSGAQISYTSSDSETHQWYKYNESANEATAISCTQTGNSSYITDVEEGWGYFVGLSTAPSTEYVWIIDYSRYLPVFYSVRYDDEDACDYLIIVADIEAPSLAYRTPRGGRDELNRTYNLKYNTLEWDEDARIFTDKEVNEDIIYETSVEAPLQNTDFTITGDKFAEHFGKSLSMRTPVYEAIAVEPYAGLRGEDDADYEIAVDGQSYGSNSAPLYYSFTAYANEPVAAFYVWSISFIPDGKSTTDSELKVRYTDKTLSYTFTEFGVYTVKLEVGDSKSMCVDSLSFTVAVGATDVKIPNFFSPGTSIGSNDVLKVSFKSLLSFQASVYNRWGNLLYQWSDPTQGWDGRVGGKFVPTGAYVVIVEYTDTSGKKQSKSQTVNVLRAKN